MGFFRQRWAKWLAVVLAVLVLGLFLLLTPAGALTKADMVGYAVCHRIASHSFSVSGRPLPLCARCTGTFLGALTGLFGQVVILRRRRETEFPPPAVLAALVGFVVMMGFDGLNSYFSMIPGAFYFYEPLQWLRLATGALNGLALSGLLMPLVNFSLWRDPIPRRVVRGWRDLGVLLALEAGTVALVLSGWPPVLYLLGLASAAGVLVMLSLVHTVLVVMVAGLENQYDSWRDAIAPLALGVALAVAQVGRTGLLRYLLTGTLAGFPGLGS
jgi:uncharacterized membrane protein